MASSAWGHGGLFSRNEISGIIVLDSMLWLRRGYLAYGVTCYQPRAAIARGKNIVVEVSMAKYWTTEMAMRVADGSPDLHGGRCSKPNPMARAWRDTRVMSIFAVTNEIMKGIPAKVMGL